MTALSTISASNSASASASASASTAGTDPSTTITAHTLLLSDCSLTFGQERKCISKSSASVTAPHPLRAGREAGRE